MYHYHGAVIGSDLNTFSFAF